MKNQFSFLLAILSLTASFAQAQDLMPSRESFFRQKADSVTFNATVTEVLHDYPSQTDSVATYRVRIEQPYENQLVIKNVANNGTSLELLLNSDGTVEMTRQYVFSNAEGEFLTYPCTIADGTVMLNKGNVKGTVTNTTLQLNSWGIFVNGSTRLIAYLARSTTITYDEGVVKPLQPRAVTWAGSGTESSPYVITQPDELLLLADMVNQGDDFRGKYVRLGNDIDMSASRSMWRQIGVDAGRAWRGSFDGFGYTIAGIMMITTEDYAGLFGYADSSSVIKNVTLSNLRLASIGQWAGGIAGYDWGRISDVSVTGSQLLHYNMYGGGIVGEYCGPELRRAIFNGRVVGYGRQGGIVGVLTGNLYDSESHGTLQLGGLADYTHRGLGGVVGTISPRGSERAWLEGCYSDASLSDASAHGDVGGVVGEAFSGTVNRCYNMGLIQTAVTYSGDKSARVPDGAVGGIVGTTWGATIRNCYNANTVLNTTPSGQVGGVIGYVRSPLTITGSGGTRYDWLALIENCYNYGQVLMPIVMPTQGLYGETYADSVFVNCYFDQQLSGNIMPEPMRHTALSTQQMTSGNLLPGMAADVWVSGEGIYPTLKNMNATDAAVVSAAPVFFNSNETTRKVKSTFTLSPAGGVQWRLFDSEASAYVKETAGLVMEGNQVNLKDISSSEMLVAAPAGGGSPCKLISLETVNPKGFVGSGTEDDPYLIQDIDDLITLNEGVMKAQNYAGDYFRQTADIDLEESNRFSGIGTDNNVRHVFGGTYNGDGHRISRLVINGVAQTEDGEIDTRKSRTNAGFFGFVAATGTVRNLIIDANCSISGFDYCGAVAGHNYGRIENCVNMASVKAIDTYAGGIAGYNDADAVIADCYNAGTILAGFKAAAGIVPYNRGLVQYCQNDGEVRADSLSTYKRAGVQSNAAGITVDNYGDAVVEGNINAGRIWAYTNSGGILAGIGAATITLRNNLNYGMVDDDSPNDPSRGSISATTPATSMSENNCYDAQVQTCDAAACAPYRGMLPTLTRSLTSGTPLDGFAADKYDWTAGQYPVVKQFKDMPAAKAHRRMVVIAADGETMADVQTQATLSESEGLEWTLATGVNFSIDEKTLQPHAVADAVTVRDTLVAVCGGYEKRIPLCAALLPFEGEGTLQNPFLIRNKEDMLRLAQLTNAEDFRCTGRYFQMTNDVDFGTTAYDPVGVDSHQFDGIFNGAGHILLNINYTAPEFEEWRGLFGTIGRNGQVKNLTLSSGTLAGSRYTAGIAGKVYGRLDSCVNRAQITTTRFLGTAGIAAQVMRDGVISHCRNEANMSFTLSMAAGIVSIVQNGGLVSDCENVGVLTSTASVAGIAASNYGTIKDCVNSAPISGRGSVAGIVSSPSGGDSVINCVNAAPITSTSSNCGGIAASNGSKRLTPSVISHCRNEGMVTGAYYTGGIAGRMYAGMQIHDCVNDGSVKASDDALYVGGIVGTMESDAECVQDIERCQNRADIVGGRQNVGGVAGSLGTHALMNDCSNYGKVVATGNNVAGLAGSFSGMALRSVNFGDVESDGYQVAGLGGNGSGTAIECVNVGNITARGACGTTAANAGGLWGIGSCHLLDCYNMGNVMAPNGYAAGLAGRVQNKAEVKRCYNAGLITVPDGKEAAQMTLP
ncbi:MAG: hypothetical protein IJ808_02735, partial [Muribaculaceae bacterium]|nr:hypothetical protein [Muribaculaceae bacterium]